MLDCEHGEMYYRAAKLALIKASVYLEDPEYVEAHVAVHLEKHLDAMAGGLTAEQESEANEDARFWLAVSGLK